MKYKDIQRHMTCQKVGARQPSDQNKWIWKTRIVYTATEIRAWHFYKLSWHLCNNYASKHEHLCNNPASKHQNICNNSESKHEHPKMVNAFQPHHVTHHMSKRKTPNSEDTWSQNMHCNHSTKPGHHARLGITFWDFLINASKHELHVSQWVCGVPFLPSFEIQCLGLTGICQHWWLKIHRRIPKSL
jgi:hypothetical protein